MYHYVQSHAFLRGRPITSSISCPTLMDYRQVEEIELRFQKAFDGVTFTVARGRPGG